MGHIEGFITDPEAVAEAVGTWQFVGAVFRDTVSDHVEQLYEYGWSDGEATLGAMVSGGIDLEFSSVKAGRWADSHSADLVTQINDSTRDMLRTTINSSVRAEESWQELKDRLVNNYAFSPQRAECIARTESGTAYNIGAVQSWRESGLVSNVEVVDGDEFDDACSEANGQVWSFEEAEANPLEHPNCVREFYPVLSDDKDSGTDDD